MNNIYLFQPNYKGGSGQFTSEWLPYTIAAIWAYSYQFDNIKENFDVKGCYFRRDPVEEVVVRLDNPAICAFSSYIWNENYNLVVAKAIKEMYPGCVIVFGGPQVDDNGIDFLARNPFVSSVVTSEGESAFHKLLEDYLTNKRVKKIYAGERMDPEILPSPYLDTPLMDQIIKENPTTKWATVFETNRGCPFRCTFCDWGSLTQSKIKKFGLEKIYAELDWIGRNGIEYLYIADANFGVFYERDKAIVDHIVKVKKKTDFPHNINATWYKNSTEKVIELILMLQEVKLNRGMTLSVQSLNDTTLEAIERKNMEISQLGRIYEICNQNRLNYYSEFILGLPYETYDTWADGLCKAVTYGCHCNIEVYTCELLRNSELTKQMDQHEIELFQFEMIAGNNQHSAIPEKHNYIIGTKYMPKEELVNSWMYGWLIINFHTMGWTQVIAKTAHKLLNKSYREIYDNLLDFIKTNTVLSKWYEYDKAEFKRFHYIDPNDITRLRRLDEIMPNHNHMVFYHNRADMIEQISLWAKLLLSGLPAHVVDDAVKLQNLYVVNFDVREDTVAEFSSNLPTYIDYPIDFIENSTEYILSNTMPWTDEQDFEDKILFRSRYGFNKRSVLKIN